MSTDTELKVEGMSCQHCVASVKEALEEVKGVQQVEVNLEGGWAKVKHAADVAKDDLEKAIDEVGFSATTIL
jgi:copper ion binding protein